MTSKVPSITATEPPSTTLAPGPVAAVGNLQQRQVVVNPAFPDAFKVVAANTLLQRVRRELHLGNDAACQHVNEYLSFLTLKAICNDWDATKLSPSAKVDEVWHLHVLDTKRYGAECQALCKQMIHHNPDGEQDPAQPMRYKNTLLAYRQIFNRVPPKDIWPDPVASASTTQAATASERVGTKRTRESQVVQLSILELNGKSHTIDVDADSSVWDLKELVQTKTAFPPAQQRLLFNGVQLADDRNLKNYAIKDKSQITLTLRLTGC